MCCCLSCWRGKEKKGVISCQKYIAHSLFRLQTLNCPRVLKKGVFSSDRKTELKERVIVWCVTKLETDRVWDSFTKLSNAVSKRFLFRKKKSQRLDRLLYGACKGSYTDTLHTQRAVARISRPVLTEETEKVRKKKISDQRKQKTGLSPPDSSPVCRLLLCLCLSRLLAGRKLLLNSRVGFS